MSRSPRRRGGRRASLPGDKYHKRVRTTSDNAASTDIRPIQALVYFCGSAGKPLGALLLSLMVGWGRRDAVAEVSVGAEEIRWFFLWRGLLRSVVPGVLALVLVLALRDTWGTIRALFFPPA